jgi:dipeptidyl aminopeptidase/acylaminoacyl peptidase
MNLRLASAVSLALAFATVSFSQKRTLQPDDYKGWESIVGREITADGKWLWYQVSLVDGDGYLVVRNCDDKRLSKVPDAGGAQFSDDSKWVAYIVAPPKAITDKLAEEHKPIETNLVVRSLETGEEQTYTAVRSFEFLKGSHNLLARRLSFDPQPGAGADLLVVDLAAHSAFPVNQVIDESPTEDGKLVAIATRTQGGDEGLAVFDTQTGTLKPILYGKGHIRSLSWSKQGNALAFLSGTPSEDHEGDFNDLNEVTGLTGKPQIHKLDVRGKNWLPAGRRVAEDRPLELSDDGSIVSFGIGDWLLKHKPDDKAHPEIWNSKDLRVVPQQRVTAAADRARTDLCVWRPVSDAIVKLTDGWQQSGEVLHGLQQALVEDTTPYLTAANNGFDYHDVYLVDTATGNKKLVVKKNHWPVQESREGGYLAFYQAKNWWIYDVKSGLAKNATAGIGTTFEDEEDDHTVPEKPPGGGPTWLAHDAGVVVEDDFDAFLVHPNGGTTRLTDGRKDHVVFRLIDPVGDEDGIEISKPLYFSAFDKDTKSSGLYQSDSAGKGKMLVLDKARIGGLRAAKHADRVVFTMGSFQDSPNLYVTNKAFSQVKPETKLNPQQAKFYWPKDELVDFKSRWGKPLQGFLIYPANYQKDRDYPMITYIYERLSDHFYDYLVPNPTNPYNLQILAQNGYFVFVPDIAYRGNTPGQNAVDCLEPAVAAVLAKHVGVNPAKIGLMGHSWGAYQTAFVTTVSPVFAAGVAGAPLTDLVSMYNTNYWNSGVPNAPILETSQGRLRVPFWEDPKTYIANSPVWQSLKRKSPILITVGDQDGAVDDRQGIALYNTLRRMGKECILLVYYGENHNFTKRADQLDYGQRLRQFMDVYLKDAKPQPWISQGIPFLKKDD